MSIADSPTPPSSAEPERITHFERSKEASAQLRGSLALELQAESGHFSEPSKNLLKFHGIYQQDDRDLRKQVKRYSFMVRCKLPGGRLTGAQYLALDALADRYGNGSLRITTRGDVQFHGVLMGELKESVAAINDTLVTTFGACGDVVRNVVCCPAPPAPNGDPLREELYRLARRISDRFLPQTAAYHEIWLDGERLASGAPTDAGEAAAREPIYGSSYLPRKFKIGIAAPGDNCVDVYTHDVGLVTIRAEHDGGRLAGFNLLVGGGMGATPSKAATFPRLADTLAFVTPDEVEGVIEAIVRLYRDVGDRFDRKRARLKYVLHDWGVEAFRGALEERLGRPLAPPRPAPPLDLHLHLGWREESEGRWTLGLSIENGRVRDSDPSGENDPSGEGRRLKSGLRAIVEAVRTAVHLTPNQDLLLTGIADSDRGRVEAILAAHHIPQAHQLSNLRLYSMACPAFPTCGLAITDAERALPGLIDRLEAEVAALGLAGERLAIRMTGCPNGCARPYVADLAFVGKLPHRYDVFVGGRLDGTRMNVLFREAVPSEELLDAVVPLFARFRDEREAGESFGDFCARVGVEALRASSPGALVPEALELAEVAHA
jgi:sulfite reductase (ferredoxin)